MGGRGGGSMGMFANTEPEPPGFGALARRLGQLIQGRLGVTRERQRVEFAINVIGLGIAGIALAHVLRPAGQRTSDDLLAVAVVGVQCVAVLLRNRQPTVAWATCLASVLVVSPDDQFWLYAAGMAQLAMLHLVSVTGRRKSALVGVMTFAVLWGAESRRQTFQLISPDTVTALVWTAGIAALGVAVRSRLDYAAAMEERTRWAVETREAEARSRVVEERLRIARELHDVVGHHVAVIRVHAGLARRTLTSAPERAAAALAETETAAQAVLREMSGILRLLREDESDGPSPDPAPGWEDLDILVDTVRHGGLDIGVDRDVDTSRITELVAVTGYRVVQECLTNARRHGGGQVDLALRTDATTLMIAVSNPVRPAPAVREERLTSGYGLTGMRERVRAVGGRLEVSESDGRFRVAAALPLDAGVDLVDAGHSEPERREA